LLLRISRPQSLARLPGLFSVRGSSSSSFQTPLNQVRALHPGGAQGT
jgi:hypothetical protein